jgi:hypothetical protein
LKFVEPAGAAVLIAFALLALGMLLVGCAVPRLRIRVAHLGGRLL